MEGGEDVVVGRVGGGVRGGAVGSGEGCSELI